MSTGKLEDEAWVQRVIERLRSDIWDANRHDPLDRVDEGRLDAILTKLRDELWFQASNESDRKAWADHVVEKLRKELWNPVDSPPGGNRTPEAEKRIEAALERLKRDLWAY